MCPCFLECNHDLCSLPCSVWLSCLWFSRVAEFHELWAAFSGAMRRNIGIHLLVCRSRSMSCIPFSAWEGCLPLSHDQMAIDVLAHASVLQSRQSLFAEAPFFPNLRVNVSIGVDLTGCAGRRPLWSGSKLRACPVGFTRHSSSCASVDSPPSVSPRGQEERSTLIRDKGRTFRTPIRGSNHRGRNDVQDVSDGGSEAMAERHPPKTASRIYPVP